ncbi:MAG: hypothetical protein APF81_20835 [Desulfosporosinus sp. BRH_c37]|nr:MAG: hypothetical protein APF81_20835 [Desulfosporosinus sp. BRH_c37]
MLKTISAYVNVALADYDESMKNHVVELMKDSLREQSTEYILEDTWGVVENKRMLYKNEDGTLEIQDPELSEISDTREMLEVMTVVLTANVG